MDIQPSIVAILARETSVNTYAGTGFLTGDGIIITCTHVVNAARMKDGMVGIQFESHDPIWASIVASSPKSDLDVTILKPEFVPPGTLCLPLTFARASIDHTFKAYGYPELSIEIPRLAGEGRIVDVVRDIYDNDVLQLNSEQVTKGYSGSPVWDKELNAVVGMINSGITLKPGISNHDTAFAIPTETLKKVYEQLELNVERGSPDPRFAVSSLRAVPPAPPPHFTGREKECDQLTKSLLSGETVAITALHGMGGIGKTALALKVAEDLLNDKTFSGGVLWWSLGPQPDLFAALSTWAMYFDKQGIFPQLQPEVRSDFVRAGLARLGRFCAIIDDVWDEESAKVLLETLPSGTAILLTTRDADLAKSLRSRVDDSLSGLPEDKCLELLANLLGPLGKYEDAAKEIARLTEGLPLALELIAGLADSPADLPSLAKQLANVPQLDLLKLPGKITRKSSIESCFALSYNALTPPLQERFRALSVFPAVFNEDALFAVWSTNDAGYLKRLLRGNLLKKDENSLLQQHNLLRAYATALLHKNSNEERIVIQRHAIYYLQFGHYINKQYLQGDNKKLESLNIFEKIWPHLQAAYENSLQNAGEILTDRWLSDFPGNTIYLITLRLSLRQLISIFENALAASIRLKDEYAEGIHLSNLGIAYKNVGELSKSLEYQERRLIITHKNSDRRGEGSALVNIGNTYNDLDDAKKAIEFYKQALPICREVSDKRSEGNALIGLGNAYYQLDDIKKAIKFYKQALRVSKEIHDGLYESKVLHNLGSAYAILNNYPKATKFYEQAFTMLHLVGDKAGEADIYWNLGLLLAKQGEFQRASELMQMRVDFYISIGHPQAEELAEQLEEVRREAEEQEAKKSE